MSEERQHHRPVWDDYFMAIVKIIAMRSNCDRLYTGAVLVKDNRIISTGYNGAPPKLDQCDEVGHLLEDGHCVRTIHAEHNALLQAAILSGTSTVGATMYAKYNPCIHCSKYIVACGIKKVVYGEVYRNSAALDYLKDAHVETKLYEENNAWNKELLLIFSESIPKRINDGEILIKGQ